MKSYRITSGALGTPGQWNSLHDDAIAGAALYAHQQLGYFSLPSNPSNGQVINLVVNGNTITLTAVTSLTGASAGSFVIGTNPLANLLNLLQNPWLTNASQTALSLANQQLLLYLGFALSGTTLTIYSQNTSLNTQLTSFTGSTTFTSGSYTANTMALYVEPGGYYIGATRVFFNGGPTPTFTAPSSHPRIDLVTINSSGTVAIVEGTENASPTAPAFPSGVIVICEVYHVVGETALYDFANQASGQGYISADTRPVVNTPASATAPFSISEVGVYSISPTPITQSQTGLSQTFSYDGSTVQSWTAPAGCTSVTITLNGGASADGIKGGTIVGTYAVTAGVIYYIFIGGAGSGTTGGQGGGGSAGAGGNGGGGMSWFSTVNSFSQGSVVMVAGGAGGTGTHSGGGGTAGAGGTGGGTTAQNGSNGSVSTTGGAGGSGSSGGAGGTGSGTGGSGTAGSAGQGGTGGSSANSIGGGGGGGGYNGGGGGGGEAGGGGAETSSGGGGGSSFSNGSVTGVTNTAGNNSGNGSATLVFNATASSTPTVAGNDSVGTITIPSTSAPTTTTGSPTNPFSEITGVTMTVTFANTFPNTPIAIVQNATLVSVSTTELVMTVGTNTTVQFLCISYK